MDFELAPGTIVGGDFRVVRPLASGGMGAVDVAEQMTTARPRAVKILRGDLAGAPGVADRFVLEAKVAARIQSDHVVEVIAAGVDHALRAPWLAMELLEGWSLDALVKQRGRLALREAAEILRQLGTGLAAAHAAGVVHRDLKPENVFVTLSRDASRGVRVKILDFGIAKVLAEAAAGGNATVAVGTPRWMAPEQTDTLSVVSPATDVWAFGLVAYHALTGRYFWRSAAGGPGANVAQLLREVLADPIPPASVRAAEQGVGDAIPPGFDGWLAGCLAREPGRRFPDAASAVTALAPILGAGHVDLGWLAAPPSAVLSPSVTPAPIRSVSPTAPTMAITAPTGATPRPRSRAGLVVGTVLGTTIGLAAVALGVAHLGFDAFRRPTAIPTETTAPLPPEPPPPPSVSAEPPPVAADPVVGEWRITEAKLPDGRAYGGRVVVADAGLVKLVTWILPGQVIQGVGRVQGDHFDVAFGGGPAYALATYDVTSGVLEGRFVEAGAPMAEHTERLTGAPSLEGTFRVAFASAGYTGDVVIRREGDRLSLARRTTGGNPMGVGLRQGNRLVVAYSPAGQAGIVTYAIAPDGKTLRGVWTSNVSTRNGTENLARP